MTKAIMEISELLEKYRRCTCCRSNHNAREIKLSYTDGTVTQGTAFVLCEECRKRLAKLLEETKQ